MQRILCAFVVGVMWSAAGAQARAQSADGASTGSSAPLMLTPPMPGGGVYGAAASASPAPSPSVSTAPDPGADPTPSAAPGDTAPTVLPPVAYQVPSVAPVGLPDVPSAADQMRARRAALLRERLRLLDTNLPPMADRSRHSRIIDGVVNLALGTGMGVLGFVAPAADPASGTNLQPWLFAYAGVTVASGIVTLAWVPDRETLTWRYMQMPFATGRERRARARYGEEALAEMAADGARRRVLGAVTGAVIPIALLGAMYWNPIFNQAPFSPGVFDVLVIGFAGIASVVSLYGLLTRSDEERLHEMYGQQMRMRAAEIDDRE